MSTLDHASPLKGEGATPIKASWVAVGSLAAGAFALVTSEFLPVGLLPDIAKGIGITNGQTGLMISLPGIFAAIAAPLSILFASRMDRRWLLCVLLACLLASNLMVATATGAIQLFAGRALLGIAIGSFWTLAGALGPRLRSGAEGVRASAVIMSGVSLGSVAGLPAGSFLGELMGWRFAFYAGAGLAVGALVAVLALLPSVPGEKSAGVSALKVLLTELPVQTRLTATILIFIGHFAAYTYLTPFLAEGAGITGEGLSALLLASGIAGFFGNIVGGWLAGKSPQRAVKVTALLLAGTMLALVLAGDARIAAMALITFWGLGFGMLPISLQSWMHAIARGRVEAMQSLLVFSIQSAIGVGALVGGLVVDHGGPTATLVLGTFSALLTPGIASHTGRPES